MLIGEIAKRTGFSKDTLRWYEKIGLIKLDRSDRRENNYRVYDQKALEQLLLVKTMKTFGFTLKEAKTFLELDEKKEVECGSMSEILNAKIKSIDEEIQRLSVLKEKITLAKTSCEGDCKEALQSVQ